MFRLVVEEGSCLSSFPHSGRVARCPAPERRPPATKALHTICGNNTSIVSSSDDGHISARNVEQIISAINHSVASSRFSSLRLYYTHVGLNASVISGNGKLFGFTLQINLMISFLHAGSYGIFYGRSTRDIWKPSKYWTGLDVITL